MLAFLPPPLHLLLQVLPFLRKYVCTTALRAEDEEKRQFDEFKSQQLAVSTITHDKEKETKEKEKNNMAIDSGSAAAAPAASSSSSSVPPKRTRHRRL